MSAHHVGFYFSITNARGSAPEFPRKGETRTAGSIARQATNEGNAMSEISPAKEAGRYEIRVKGHLDNRWAIWFDGLTLTTNSDGTTTLDGIVVDQSALHGLLQKVRAVGLPLISVTRVEPEQPDVAN